ncbi:5-oxoprolinase subunit PxpA [Kangiella marina]|uniref:5-oxoprolinase subunit PxpA n=1 Tax=Kangiella marina TaxID=1079178 RepID=A0ABP8ILQ5_9GAMM
MSRVIDINCDLGESILPEDWAKDAELMPYISSCNIACGGHAGNSESIQAAIHNATQHQLAIGAHPSYPDRENFGRQSMKLSDTELRKTLRLQLNSIIEGCNHHGVTLHHVKPHGALYNDAADDLHLAMIIAQEVAHLSGSIKLMGLAESAMLEAAHKVGLDFINEGFMDRNYQPNKRLVPRSEPTALHANLDDSLHQALQFALGEPISIPNGQQLMITVDSICLHGDNPDALAIAQALHQRLAEHKITIYAGR